MQLFRQLLCGLLLSAAALFTLSCGDEVDDGPQAVAVDFMEKFITGDGQNAITLLYLPEDDARNAEMIAGKIGAMSVAAKKKTDSSGGLDKIEVQETKLQGDNENKATVRVLVTFGDGTAKKENIKLIKDAEGKWKVAL